MPSRRWIRPRSRPAGAAPRGQSVVEFALVLPIMLAMVGITLDLARVFHVWIDLESASRSVAEQLAMNVDGSVTPANAATLAGAQLANQVGGTFRVAEPGACPERRVTATYATSSAAVGASASFPMATVRVAACIPFRPLFAYPLVTIDGAWVVRASHTFQILQGR